jgi:hypothetical protein
MMHFFAPVLITLMGRPRKGLALWSKPPRCKNAGKRRFPCRHCRLFFHAAPLRRASAIYLKLRRPALGMGLGVKRRMAGGSVGMPPPAIFIIHVSKPRPLAAVVVEVMMVMVMTVGLCRGGHCQNGKSCASENQFL